MSLIKLRKKLVPFTPVKLVGIETKNGIQEIRAYKVKVTYAPTEKKAIITAFDEDGRYLQTTGVRNIKNIYEILEFKEGTYITTKKTEFLNDKESIYAEKGDVIILTKELLTTSYGKHLSNPSKVNKNFSYDSLELSDEF